jgi:hypothetical protein
MPERPAAKPLSAFRLAGSCVAGVCLRSGHGGVSPRPDDANPDRSSYPPGAGPKLLPFGPEDERFIDSLIDEAVREWMAKNSRD